MLGQYLAGLALAATVSAAIVSPRQAKCPGYNAENVKKTGTGLTADLSLAGPACNRYGRDIKKLKLSVNYDTSERLHVKIEDNPSIAYQVPNSNKVFTRPSAAKSVSAAEAELSFTYEESPFSFRVIRKANKEILFDSSAAPLIFQDQYLRVRTALPKDPNLYGLGEHTDPFRLNTTDYTRTLWSRDAYGIPSGTNLYGNHPVYFDHRGKDGTHGVFLLSSSGMDVKIDRTSAGRQYLEYNLMSGVLDFYFVAGPTPTKVSQQYAEIVGRPVMMPYWGFGFHQCRYGYRDFYSIAEVIANYSTANIPLETMWTDIDYMYARYIMTTDPDRFPIPRMRQIVDHLHNHDQHYVVMVDPAIAYKTKKYNDEPYSTFLTARKRGIFLQRNATIYQGVVWPGVTAFPDWFNPETQSYWSSEFLNFFSASQGIDIDALWIDMNEAANFNYFGDDPRQSAKSRGFPPARAPLRSQPRPIPGFPRQFQPGAAPYPPRDPAYAPPWLAPPINPQKPPQQPGHPPHQCQHKEPRGSIIGYRNRNFLNPPYQISNANTHERCGGLSNNTLATDIVHSDGHVELDVHNLYGTMMSTTSRNAMLARRPRLRPLVITRSTFAGAGRHVGKWLGDNLSTWDLYKQSIQGMLDFATLFQIPMVGSDICGFGGNTTSTLCARWATLGAFYPFMRNHNGDSSIPQEFFVWPLVAKAARNALDIRYRLLDYIYTAMHKQSTDGTPLINPMFFIYPNDVNTFANALQFFYGDSVLVSPVTEENKTSVTIYVPNDRFYKFDTWEVVEGKGANVKLTDVGFTEITLHVRGGTIIPMRDQSAYTTTATRKKPFNVVVAPDRNGKATGSLYLDDGVSIKQPATSEIKFNYAGGVLNIGGTFGYKGENSRIAVITILDSDSSSHGPSWQKGDSGSWTRFHHNQWSYDSETRVTRIKFNKPLDEPFSLHLG